MWPYFQIALVGLPWLAVAKRTNEIAVWLFVTQDVVGGVALVAMALVGATCCLSFIASPEFTFHRMGAQYRANAESNIWAGRYATVNEDYFDALKTLGESLESKLDSMKSVRTVFGVALFISSTVACPILLDTWWPYVVTALVLGIPLALVGIAWYAVYLASYVESEARRTGLIRQD
jgi:hypothetical protein